MSLRSAVDEHLAGNVSVPQQLIDDIFQILVELDGASHAPDTFTELHKYITPRSPVLQRGRVRVARPGGTSPAGGTS